MRLDFENSFWRTVMKKVRYAVIGNGWITQEAFLPGVNQTGNAEVVAIVSGHRDKAEKVANFHGIPKVYDYADYDAMLKRGEVDAVYIALPNSLHADYAIRAANAGVHVLVEKPLAISIAESSAMIAAAAKAGVWLSTAYRLHTDEATLKLYDLIKTGTIGDPRHFISSFSFQIGAGNHRLLAKHWGGALQDIGVYCINSARHVFAAEPVEVAAMDSLGHDDERFAEVPATVSTLMRFPSGRIASFTCSFGADVTDTYSIIGSTGQITLANPYRFEVPRAFELRRGDKVERFDFPLTDNFSGQTAYFSDCILKGTKPEPDGEDGLADMIIMLAIEEASRTGQSQKIKIPRRPAYAGLSQSRSFPPVSHRLVL
jgi:predicted dehydrogenase